MLFAALLAMLPFASSAPAEPAVELIATITVAADARDASGLSTVMGSGLRADTLGSMGSGIAYTGVGNRYLMVADRGPRDGADEFRCRWHEVEIAPPGTGASAVSPWSFKVVSTTLLSDRDGVELVGLKTLLGSSSEGRGRRFDPECVRVLPSEGGKPGDVLIGEEYGPRLVRFDRATGRAVREYALPGGFSVDSPRADAKDEIEANRRGRVTNNALEGLALSGDGATAYALMQGPLIQDGGKKGECLRLVEVDLRSGSTKQYVYPLIDDDHRTNEVLWMDGARFVVIERDNSKGAAAKSKRLRIADLAGATEIHGVESLPKKRKDLPATITPIATRDWVDLLALDPATAKAGFPEKIEGLAWGPDLPDGRRCLLVTSDNDFLPDQPTYVWVLGVGAKKK